MIGLPPAVKIFMSTQPVDMRRLFDGLAGFVALVPEHGPPYCGAPV